MKNKTEKQLQDQAKRIFYGLLTKEDIHNFDYNDVYISLSYAEQAWIQQNADCLPFEYVKTIDKGLVTFEVTYWGSIDQDDYSVDGFDFTLYTPSESVEVNDFTDYIEGELSKLEEVMS